MKKRDLRGFTLMELLVAVAILGTLTALGLPMLSSALEGSRRSACLANLGALQNRVEVTLLKNRGKPQPELLAALNAETADYTCPGGGVYSVAVDKLTGDWQASCSVHSHHEMTVLDYFTMLQTGIADNRDIAFTTEKGTFTSLESYFKKMVPGNGTRYLNSEAPSATASNLEGAASAFEAALKEFYPNVDFDTFSWQAAYTSYNNGANTSLQLFWSEDISKLKPGDTVTVYQCVASCSRTQLGLSEGVLYQATAKVSTKDYVDKATKKTGTYNILSEGLASMKPAAWTVVEDGGAIVPFSAG